METLPIAFLHPEGRPRFPHAARALASPNGLLAAGGALTPEWLLAAYARGIFPWFSPGEPILWWSPSPRCVFRPGGVHVSRRLHRQLRQWPWQVVADRDFAAVIDACAAPRASGAGTWIGADMRAAYLRLHALGHAHSIEVRAADGALVGGLYGVAVGRVFCGESMFSARSGGSKVALLALSRRLREWGWSLLDAQVPNPHLLRLGAQMLPRPRYLELLAAGLDAGAPPGSWHAHWTPLRAPDLA